MVAGWSLTYSISYQRKWKFPPPLPHWWNNSPGGWGEDRIKQGGVNLHKTTTQDRFEYASHKGSVVTAPCPRGSWPSSKPKDWHHWQTADALPVWPSPGSNTGRSWLERRTLQKWRRWPPLHPLRWWGWGEETGQHLTGSAKTLITSALLLGSIYPTRLTQWSQTAALWSGSEDGWSQWCHTQPGWHLLAGLHAGWHY